MLHTKPASHQQPLGKYLSVGERALIVDEGKEHAGPAECSQSSDMGDAIPICCDSDINKEVLCTTLSTEKQEDIQECSQVFHDAPPSDIIVISKEGGAQRKGVVDWSREARRKRVLERAADNVNQTLLTDYYGIIDEIQHLSQNHEILTLLKRNESYEPSFSAVLKQIIANAEKNVNALPQGKRHPEILKKFTTALFIYAGH